MANTVAQLRAVMEADVRNFQAGMKTVLTELKNVEAGAKGAGEGAAKDLDKPIPVIERLKTQAAALGKSFEAAGKSMSTVGRTLTVGVTAPLVAVATAAVVASEQIDDAMDRIRIGTGATGPVLHTLQEDFRAVFAEVPSSAAEVSTAIAELNTRLGLTGAPLQQMSTQMLALARITKTDVTETVRGATRVFGDWSIASEHQAGSLDTLFRASQATGTSMSGLFQTLVQYGAPMRQLGFDFETAAVLLAKFEKEGVNAELVMGSLRIALGKMSKEGVTDVAAGLTELTARIKSAGTDAKANAIAFEYFGARAGADLAAAVREGRFELGELLAVVKSGPETINAAAQATDGLAETFALLQNKVTLALAPLGDELVKILLQDVVPILEQAAAVVKDLSEWFAALPEPVRKLVIVVGLLAAVVGPVIWGLGTMATAIGGLMTALAPLLPALLAIGAFLTGPLGIAIAVGVAAIATIGGAWLLSGKQAQDSFDLMKRIASEAPRALAIPADALASAVGTLEGLGTPAAAGGPPRLPGGGGAGGGAAGGGGGLGDGKAAKATEDWKEKLAGLQRQIDVMGLPEFESEVSNLTKAFEKAPAPVRAAAEALAQQLVNAKELEAHLVLQAGAISIAIEETEAFAGVLETRLAPSMLDGTEQSSALSDAIGLELGGSLGVAAEGADALGGAMLATMESERKARDITAELNEEFKKIIDTWDGSYDAVDALDNGISQGLNKSLADLQDELDTTTDLQRVYEDALEDGIDMADLNAAAILKTGTAYSNLDPKQRAMVDRLVAITRATDTSRTAFGLFEAGQNALRTSGERLTVALRDIQARSEVMGPSFDALGSTIAAIRQEMIRLRELGVEPTHAAYIALQARLNDLTPLQAARDGMTSLFDSVFDAVDTAITGVIQGTTTLGEAFKNLGQSIALELGETLLEAVLDPLKKILSEILILLVEIGIQWIRSLGSGGSGGGSGDGASSIGSVGDIIKNAGGAIGFGVDLYKKLFGDSGLTSTGESGFVGTGNVSISDTVRDVSSVFDSSVFDSSLWAIPSDPFPWGEYMSTGGRVAGSGTTDTVPAMLTPGEFVVNRDAAMQHRALLEAINGTGGGSNQRGGLLYMAEGGEVPEGVGIAKTTIGMVRQVLGGGMKISDMFGAGDAVKQIATASGLDVVGGLPGVMAGLGLIAGLFTLGIGIATGDIPSIVMGTATSIAGGISLASTLGVTALAPAAAGIAAVGAAVAPVAAMYAAYAVISMLRDYQNRPSKTDIFDAGRWLNRVGGIGEMAGAIKDEPIPLVAGFLTALTELDTTRMSYMPAIKVPENVWRMSPAAQEARAEVLGLFGANMEHLFGRLHGEEPEVFSEFFGQPRALGTISPMLMGQGALGGLGLIGGRDELVMMLAAIIGPRTLEALNAPSVDANAKGLPWESASFLDYDPETGVSRWANPFRMQEPWVLSAAQLWSVRDEIWDNWRTLFPQYEKRITMQELWQTLMPHFEHTLSGIPAWERPWIEENIGWLSANAAPGPGFPQHEGGDSPGSAGPDNSGVAGPPGASSGEGAGTFALGGVVPGAPGAPMLATVHGGEQVLTPEQQAALAAAISPQAGSGADSAVATLAGSMAEQTEYLRGLVAQGERLFDIGAAIAADTAQMVKHLKVIRDVLNAMPRGSAFSSTFSGSSFSGGVSGSGVTGGGFGSPAAEPEYYTTGNQAWLSRPPEPDVAGDAIRAWLTDLWEQSINSPHHTGAEWLEAMANPLTGYGGGGHLQRPQPVTAEDWLEAMANPLQGFARGGIVRGALGSPQLAIVHGGEEVLTPEERGGGRAITIEAGAIVVQGATDPAMTAQAVFRQVRRLIQLEDGRSSVQGRGERR